MVNESVRILTAMVTAVWHFNHSVCVISQLSSEPNGTRVEIRKLAKSFAPSCQWTCGNVLSTQYRRDKAAVRTTLIRNVTFDFIKIRTGCHYEG